MDRYSLLLLLLLAVIVGGWVWWEWHSWSECRAAFSSFTCIRMLGG